MLSATQQAVLERVASHGSSPSEIAAGRAGLLSLLGAQATHEYLKQFDDGSRLHEASPAALLASLELEFESAELVHNFGDNEDKPFCGLDMSVNAGPTAEWFYNLWELNLKGVIPPPDAYWCEKIEVDIFGYPPFKDPAKPDWDTASDRMVWGALNIFRKSLGNPVCGPVSAVISRRHVGLNALVTPTDSGMIKWSRLDPNKFEGILDAMDWPEGFQPLGTPGAYLHLLPAYLRWAKASAGVAGVNYQEYNLARLLTRLLSRHTYALGATAGAGASIRTGNGDAFSTGPWSGGASGRAGSALPLNFLESRCGYFEFNPVTRVAIPEGILLMVVSFGAWFGSERAERLRQWCIAQGWPLAWAFSPDYATWPACQNGGVCFDGVDANRDFDPSSVRLLDPVVLAAVPAGRNVSSHAGFQHAASLFSSKFAAAALASDDSGRSSAAWLRLLTGDSMVHLAAEPVRANACPFHDCAAVLLLDSSCICDPRIATPRGTTQTQTSKAPAPVTHTQTQPLRSPASDGRMEGRAKGSEDGGGRAQASPAVKVDPNFALGAAVHATHPPLATFGAVLASLPDGEVRGTGLPRNARSLTYTALGMWNSRGGTLEVAIRAMLGDPNAYFETPAMTVRKLQLQFGLESANYHKALAQALLT